MDLRRIDLNLLLVFDAVLAERSVSRAAARLALTQPAVSHALARLRQACGDPIVERRGRTMVPTPRAVTLQPEVRALLTRAERVFTLSGDFDPCQSTRVFQIGSSDLAAQVLLAPVLGVIRSRAPGVRLHLLHAGRNDAIDLIRAGTLDIALGVFHSADETVQIRTVRDSPYVCAMAASHPLAQGELTLARYLSAAHLQVLVQPGTFGVIEQTLARRGAERDIRLTAAHFGAALAMLRSGANLLLTAPADLFPQASCDGLCLRSPPFEVEPYRHQVALSRRASDDPGLAWLVEHIVRGAVA